MDRRAFVYALGAATLAGCAKDDPCGTHNPWTWAGTVDARAAAKELMGSAIEPWDAIEGRSSTRSRFRNAVDRCALRPRVLIDVRDLDLTTTLLATPLRVPLLIGPAMLALEDRECVDHILAGARSAGVQPIYPLGLRSSPAQSESRLFAAHWECFPSEESAKVLASGITSVDAAVGAVGRGARALLIENSSSSSIELLPLIRRAVPGHVELVASGAFRGGNDVLIALALGARAVTVGWPVIWGARASRAGGAFRALDLIEWGLVRGLRLCGCPSITRFDHRFVREVRQLDLSGAVVE